MLRHTVLTCAVAGYVVAQKAGSIVETGNTLVSAMMMFLGNNEKVYMLDKVEGNAQQINGHPAWASVYDIASQTASLQDFASNPFCSSGMHLPNGSYATFGGNGAIGPGGNGTLVDFNPMWNNADGRKSIRILNPCTGDSGKFAPDCQWFDNAAVLSMQRARWYSTAEPLGDGTVALIGGFASGGYINRNHLDSSQPQPSGPPDPDAGSENSIEYYPSRGPPTTMQFLRQTSGLNAYAHTFLTAGGKLFIQANYSTLLYDPDSGTETPLPEVPGRTVRVYPASGAVAMLPLTPANNYTPTILLCGGQDDASMNEYAYGNFSWPYVNTWEIPASKSCSRITPDDASPSYTADDDMLDGRTMGQFIILPTGQMVVVNGGKNGTAGYSDKTLLVQDISQMPFGMSLASDPIGTPALYDPSKPAGKRWSNAGFGSSKIPRLYHSSAILLPDASVLIAGSNPNVDVNTSTVFPTTYQSERFYPAYFQATTRPVPSGIPKTITYGGASFDLTVPASGYSGAANDAASNTTVVLIRPGWTTHGMNMGQRFVQLNNTFTVQSNGDIVLHTSQAPPNSNLIQPGPAMLFVVVNGIPSNGTFVTVGSGKVETQKVLAVADLPASVRVDGVAGSASKGSTSGSGGSTNGDGNNPSSSSGFSTTKIIAAIVAGVVVVAVVGAITGICITRRRRARTAAAAAYGSGAAGGAAGGPDAGYAYPMEAPKSGGYQNVRASGSSAFVPLHNDNPSTASFIGGPQSQYYDDPASASRPSFNAAPMQDPHYGPTGGYDGQYHNPAGYSRHAQQPSYADSYYDESRMR